jgi:diaminohydroxyphosphoribosylaminopyrimidine deaminase/5-amino-6-(5-phosphoribosylamino)uracil reductase
MALCIELAQQAEGRTAPNPMVGAVVIDSDGNVIAEGYHRKAGDHHAEVEALDKAGDAARGATLIVSLEPCCHHGKTPPCSDRVIASGIKTVVCGMVDPNPKVGGGGIAALRNAGIEVITGILEEDCKYLNRAWLKWIEIKVPWVALKMAATLDGKIADRNGQSRWISGPDARHFVHQLRNQYDCVMVGSATAISDNAQLTVRDIEGGRNPVRVVLDRELQTPGDSHLLSNDDGNTWLYASEEAIEKKGKKFAGRAKLISTPTAQNLLSIPFILGHLGENRMLSVLCEGGGRLASALLPHVDQVYWISAPKLMNDQMAVSVLDGSGASDLSQIKPMYLREIRQFGDDVMLNYLK